MTTFKNLGLSGAILEGVLDAGYTSPTPIQTAAIPIACDGGDIIGCAQTGTGKTAAFVLPMLQHLTDTARKGRPIRALVVTPTRELALQVEEAVQVYGARTPFRSVAIFGGVSIGPQLQQLRRGVDIVVATPGRLLDHINRGSVDLSRVEILVLDEADRMLDMGFINDIRKIVARTPRRRQTMLFSATMPPAIEELSRTILRHPEFIQIGHRRNPAETVLQQVYHVANSAKMDLLYHVLEQEPTDNVIVFSRTKHRADRIMKKLARRGFSATVMHSNRSQGQRQRALQGFRDGTFQILVATDIAARGIDVDSISHVINYDMPNQVEDYIHRIGRTGRAEATGEAITFVTNEDTGSLRDIERHTGKRLATKVYDGLELAVEDPPRPAGQGSGNRSGQGNGRGRRPQGAGNRRTNQGNKNSRGRSGSSRRK